MVKLLGLLGGLALLALLAWGAAASAQAPTPGGPLYLALGDSLAAGIGASDPATRGYAALSLALLRGIPAYSRLELRNLAVPGETSASMLAPSGQLERAQAEVRRRQGDGDPANDLRLISLHIGGNDIFAALLRPECLPDPRAEACRERLLGQAVPGVEERLRRILAALREAAGPQVPIVMLTLYNPLSGAPVGDPADEIFAAVGQRYFRLAAEVGVEVVDILPLFRGRGPQLTHILSLDPHPNDEGYRLIAEALTARLEALLSRSPASPPVALPATGSEARAPWTYLLLAASALMGLGALAGIVGLSRHGRAR